MKELLKELENYTGRGSVSPKAEFYHKTAISVMRLFETRTYADLKLFADLLKHYGKTVEIKFHGVEYHTKSDEQFYTEKL